MWKDVIIENPNITLTDVKHSQCTKLHTMHVYSKKNMHTYFIDKKFMLARNAQKTVGNSSLNSSWNPETSLEQKINK